MSETSHQSDASTLAGAWSKHVLRKDACFEFYGDPKHGELFSGEYTRPRRALETASRRLDVVKDRGSDAGAEPSAEKSRQAVERELREGPCRMCAVGSECSQRRDGL